MNIGEVIYNEVIKLDDFSKKTIGIQLLRATDSIAANLSEGMGRYHYKERKNFSYYSRGSLFETKTWLTKANNRKLISNNDFSSIIKDLETIGIKLNNYINTIGK